ncbi:MAG TPA: LPS assembly protein LptD, partial [Candidatus Berkiella sp.]|nr:LPS assembly protein LptD [Candidatus Berkiella sp.]
IFVVRPPNAEWEKLIADGHIHYTSPGLNIWGQHAEYLHADQLFSLEGTSYRWYARHARGHAKHITVQKDEINLYDATYTTCAPTQNTWELSAKRLTFFPKTGRAVVNHIRFDLNEFPIFYFPYFNYPIDNKRHSGFLFPSYGATSNSGNEIIIPYYWNIAPNYDAVFAGRWLSERGTEAQTKLRYLFGFGEGTLQWHFLPHDRKYSNFSKVNRISPPGGLPNSDPRILGLDGSDSRYAVNYRHTSQFGYHWQLNMIFDQVSDDNYFVDLGNDIQTASTVQLPQQANLSYYGEHWTHTFNIEEYQVLQPLSKPINEEIYKRQPQWIFQAVYPEQWLNLTYGLAGETVNFAHKPNLLTRAPVTTGQRLHLRPSLSLPIEGSYFFITPRYQLDWLQYLLDLDYEANQKGLPHHPSRTIPLYNVDSGLFFERSFVYQEALFKQTLEPRLYYLYVPYRNQSFYPNFDSGINNFSYSQLFRDNRFSGHDRISDANQISVSLTSRLLPQEGGRELFRGSIGQIFYFQKRRVSLCEELGQENICHF